MYNIAIDMGGTRLKVGLFSGSELIEYTVVPSCTQQDFGNTIKLADAEISKLKEQYNVPAIEGIGLTIPGIVDTKQNKVLDINVKYADSKVFDLNNWAKGNWNTKLVTENDARAALVGEWQNGSGKGINNLVMITLGTGIGGAALIEGNLLHGKHFQAGCLGGHFTIDFQGGMCNCGNKGCVESRGSSWVLPQLAKEENYDGENISFESLFNAMRTGDKKAEKILRICIDAWSACAVNLIHAYDPEMVIVVGGVMKSADIILPEIRKWVKSYAWTPWGTVDIEKAALEDTAALYGMNYLINKI